MKYELEIEYDFDFDLIGISCHHQDYRLCWALNNSLNLGLSKDRETLDINNKKRGLVSKHALFSGANEDLHEEYILVNNRSLHGFLLPERKEADYLLLLKNCQSHNINNLLTEIKKIDLILTAFSIDVKSLKSKENLIL